MDAVLFFFGFMLGVTLYIALIFVLRRCLPTSTGKIEPPENWPEPPKD